MLSTWLDKVEEKIRKLKEKMKKIFPTIYIYPPLASFNILRDKSYWVPMLCGAMLFSCTGSKVEEPVIDPTPIATVHVSPTPEPVETPDPEPICHTSPIRKIGACDHNGTCGVLLENGHYMKVDYPVEGANGEECEDPK